MIRAKFQGENRIFLSKLLKIWPEQCGWEWRDYIQYMPYLISRHHRQCSTINAVPRQSFVIHPNGGWWQSNLSQPSFFELKAVWSLRQEFNFKFKYSSGAYSYWHDFVFSGRLWGRVIWFWFLQVLLLLWSKMAKSEMAKSRNGNKAKRKKAK
jgi:hypothetical protein